METAFVLVFGWGLAIAVAALMVALVVSLVREPF